MEWLDRPSPAADAAERALLGGLLLEPERLAEVQAEVQVADLHRPTHRALLEVLLSMAAAGEPIDLVSVSTRLHATGLAERCGGLAYVAELPEHCPSSANLRHYAGEIREAAQRRRLIELGVRLANRAYAGELPSAELVSETIRELCDLEEHARYRTRSHAEVVPEVIEAAHDQAAGAAPAPLSTGYQDRYGLDAALNGGLRQGHLVVVGGATGMGKSGLALSIAAETARNGGSVLYVSGELRDHELHTRLLAYMTGISSRSIASGDLTDAEVDVLEAYQPARVRVHGYHRPRCTLAHVQTEARRMWSRGELQLIVVDYLQIMHLVLGRNELRTTAIGQLAIDLRELAEELSVPVVALAQLKADWMPRARADARKNDGDVTAPWYAQFTAPELGDIADSSEIAKTADVVLFPVTARALGYTDRDSEGAVFIGKSRVGPTGVVTTRFDAGSGCYRPYGRAP